METNFKGTRGEADFMSADRFGVPYIIHVDNETVFQCYNTKKGNDAKENVELVIDAFNIRQQINFDLPELLEQRNKAVELLEKLTNDATFLEDAKQFLKTLEK